MTNKLSPELIRSRIERDLVTECWNWVGAVQTSGYGQIRFDGKNGTAHRASWIAHNGSIPPALQVLHHCDNPRCCNPQHLYLGTHTDNMRDMNRRNRRTKGKFSKSKPPALLDNSA